MGDLGNQKAEGKPNKDCGGCVQVATSCGRQIFACTVCGVGNSIAWLSRNYIQPFSAYSQVELAYEVTTT
jgi:hypothetical protein